MARADVIDLFQRAVDGVNVRLAPFETSKRFALLPTEFTIPGGELTPTMKVKRRVVEERWRTVIDALYEEAIIVSGDRVRVGEPFERTDQRAFRRASERDFARTLLSGRAWLRLRGVRALSLDAPAPTALPRRARHRSQVPQGGGSSSPKYLRRCALRHSWVCAYSATIASRRAPS